VSTRRGSGWCATRTQTIYTSSGRRMPYVQSGGERSVLSYTEVLVVGVTSESERGRGSQVSGRDWSVCVCAALLEPSQGLGELCDRVIV
jgi:hypothetical protein